MGSVTSYFTDAYKESQREVMIRQRLGDIKAQKRQRDFTMAMQMATIRDRVYWMSAFYVTMGAVRYVGKKKLSIFQVWAACSF